MSVFQSIKRTIKYSQKYGGKLTGDQLYERLIGDKVYIREKIFNVLNPSVLRTSPFDKRETFAKEKIDKAKELAKKIKKHFKNILFLGITGSVAAEYPKKNDDIDLIIITKINKLWITRLKLRLFITFNKIPHRRFGKKEKRDDFCFNLWLDEKSLRMKYEKQTLRNAVDLILVKPLINRNKTYERFILANDWAKKWVATPYESKIFNFQKPIFNENKKENKLDKMINYLVFWPQFWYMKRRIKNEKVGLHEAFFHH